MKKRHYIISALFACIFGTINTYAQQTVNLKINHMLGNEFFSMGTTASNSLDNHFQVSRLEYYISDIELKGIDGSYTAIPDTWLLIQPENENSTTLSLANFEEPLAIEGIRFHIGVGPDVNHEDPSLYEASHPLAPKSPSMHWGWTSGYRFVAIEGKCGDAFVSTFEFHALGDDNYFQTEVTSLVETSGDITTIEVTADYTGALSNIDMSTGVVLHGDNGDAVRLLKNFRDFVFKETTGLSVQENISQDNIRIFPSHTTDGYFTIENPSNKLASIQVYNYAGQMVKNLNATQEYLQLQTKGVYSVVLLDASGNKIDVKRLTVL